MQGKLAQNRNDRSRRAKAGAPSLLAGLIFDAAGERMTSTHATKASKRYRYYASASLIVNETGATDGKRTSSPFAMRAPAGDIEALVLDRLRSFLAAPAELATSLAPLLPDATAIDAALCQAQALTQRWPSLSQPQLLAIVRPAVERVAVQPERIDLNLTAKGIAGLLYPPACSDAAPGTSDLPPITLSIEARIKRFGKGKRLVIQNGAPRQTNDGLIRLLAESRLIQKQFFSGAHESVEAMTERLGLPKGRASALLRIAYLSPTVVRAIVEGRQPLDLTPTRLLKLSKDLSHDWVEQQRVLGFRADA